MSKNSNKVKTEKLNKFYLLGFIVVILWVVSIALIYFIIGDNWSDRASFGDSFGAINSLYSGLALAGIIYTILLQRNELGLQREELTATRIEFEKQNETLVFQRFENTFFNMLSIHHSIVSSIDVEVNPLIIEHVNGEINLRKENRKNKSGIVDLKGRDVFQRHYETLIRLFNFDDNQPYIILYEQLFDYYQSDLGHYFRNVYRIIKLVDETKFSDDENVNYKIAYSYTSILRAQLSDYELVLLCFNGLSKYGSQKLKPLLEKYAMLKNLKIDLLHYDKVSQSYKNGAYRKPTFN